MTTGLLLRGVEVAQLVTILTLGTALLLAGRQTLSHRAVMVGAAHLWVTFSFAVGVALNASLNAAVTPALPVLAVLLLVPTVLICVAAAKAMRDNRN